MEPVVLWTLVALGTAVVVLVVAGAIDSSDGGLRGFVADLRAGLRRDPARERGSFLTEVRADLHDTQDEAETSVEELFSFGAPQGRAYLGTEELTAPLARATHRLRPVRQHDRRPHLTQH